MLTADEWILIGALVAATSIVWLPPIIGFACWVVAAVQDRRGEAAERSDKEESFDLSVEEAILLTHEAIGIEEFEEDVDLIARLEIEFRADRTVQRLANKLGGK